ncbi:MAG: glycosyltransferase family 39 protein [Candidatus Shapirobacteria bacterium]|nr:glycosyltransferase family 39 protein [Candidatus Shapirobacteria bacterium]
MAKTIFKKIKIILFYFLLATALALFFSYKILDVPMGLTADETALGYNATLLSKTGHDENGRVMPIFVLSNDGVDWKQPVPQYYITLLFKIFSPSIFLLRFSSVIITIISVFLIFKLSQNENHHKFYFFTAFLFLTTPLIMIQSHMGLDNIIPIPFTIIWLLFLFRYDKSHKNKFLIISAISLGITFYTYKGMRAVFPIWYLLSLIYLIKPKIKLFPLFIFSCFSLPFILISPFLNHLYPGSILGGVGVKFDSIYNFMYPYLSSFDPTFLFIKGDDTLYHSTGIHGMFLLSTLPIFLIGIYTSISKNKNSRFLLTAFFFGPLLYGTVNSIHRASRLMCLIPIYVLICTNGLIYLKSILNKYYILAISLLIILMTLNYFSFLSYYYSTYAKLTFSIVGDLKEYTSFKYLSQQSKKLNLTPYVAKNISKPFYEAIYFPNGIKEIHEDLTPPSGSILLTNREDIDSMVNIKAPIDYYQIQIN